MKHTSEHTYFVKSTGEEFTVRVVVDIDAVAKELAYKAFCNKSKRATALSQTVIVEVKK